MPAIIYVNYIKERLHKINPYTKVKLIIDGGLFMDAQEYQTNKYTFRKKELAFSYLILKNFNIFIFLYLY